MGEIRRVFRLARYELKAVDGAGHEVMLVGAMVLLDSVAFEWGGGVG